MRPTLFAALISATALLAGAAHGASVSKTYSYFSIGGASMDEIEAELAKRGPKVGSTGQRHPGATAMAFTSKLRFQEQPGSCRIVGADVTVKAKVSLPRWRRPRAADEATRLIWDTLAADIERHEETHVRIAKNHARDLETALRGLGRFKTCEAASAKAKAATDRLLGRHDSEQARFDRVESKNFESRVLRSLERRLQRMGAVRQPD